MQRQRDGELVPIAEAFSDLSGPVAALRDASPQARHHFTQADQVTQLVTASETTPDLGFMARLLVLCSLPRTNPGNRYQYKRQNGPYTLYMFAGRDRWLNPPEWVEWVDEPVPGYPKRPVPRDEDAAKALKKRTLTNLYNARPQWLADAHEALDAAVAAAYGWPADISDDEVLRELLALNGGC